jgi:hypothetical protein
MATTFLHEDKALPPDEAVDARAPACPNCGNSMWLKNWTRHAGDDGLRDARIYECKGCGASVEIGSEPCGTL